MIELRIKIKSGDQNMISIDCVTHDVDHPDKGESLIAAAVQEGIQNMVKQSMKKTGKGRLLVID